MPRSCISQDPLPECVGSCQSALPGKLIRGNAQLRLPLLSGTVNYCRVKHGVNDSFRGACNMLGVGHVTHSG